MAVIDHAETALARDRGVVWGYGERLEVPSFGHIPLEIVLYAPAKRRFDIAVSAAAIVLFAPVFLLCALAVRLTSKGPILFRQTRVGQGGKLFTCFKFRSMHVGAEKRRKELLHLNEMSGPVFKITRDPRMTWVGRYMRKLSLDELPQLFNVLWGDMSIVGPRPPIPDEVLRYTDHQLKRLSVRPGLTCIWQISGRSNIPFDRWVELDIAYIEIMSMKTDLNILVKTIPAVLTGRGAV